MAGKAQPIPSNYNRVMPYLIVNGAADAIKFYENIFGAKEIMRMPGPDNKIGHAEIEIGDSIVMLADESLERGHKSAKTLGGSPVGLVIYVEDVDRTVERAVAS